jgi:hypothetical protein
MKKVLVTFVLFFLAFGSFAFAQLSPADSVIEGNINSNAFLTKSKRYLLRGFVNVNPPAVLTIQAGTIIYGEKSSKGTLIINRGAKLLADGTANNPIVFTSQQPQGQRGPGDWGGIILAGYASINVPGGTAVIEGGTGTVYGGGAAPDDDDNSGILRYVRIEYPGIAFLPDNEINGLTMGGVGRGTTIEYIQVNYSGDDSYEWFGGTVNAKYLIACNGVDDDFDTDFGYRGKIQFAFGLRNPNIADISGSNGFESDNDGTGTFNSPRTQPWFSNATVVGPMSDTSAVVNPNYRRGAHLRRSTQTSIYNSIVMGYPVGLLIDGANSANAALGDTLQIKNSIWAGLKAGNGITTNASGFSVSSWFNDAGFGNRTFIQPSEVGLTDPFNLTNPNPVPNSSSPAASGASFTNTRLQDPFFTTTTYVGAFSPTEARWDALWTNYNPDSTNYVTGLETNNGFSPAEFKLEQNFPNPFNPSTLISYSLPISGIVTLKVYNVIGQVVAELVNEYQEAGKYTAAFSSTNLASGVYIYKLSAGDHSSIKKMNLIK